MWLAPKTDWRSTDFFNIEDWQRLRSNLEYVRTWSSNHGMQTVELLETDTGRGYAELPYVHLVNNMEKNLATIREFFDLDFTEDIAQKTWYERLDSRYESNPTYQDWNRWERILLKVHESIQYIDTVIFTPISGTCYSGSERTLIRFSRGR